MKPKDLKSPFFERGRVVHLHDRVFYVPLRAKEYSSFRFPGWDAPEVFGNVNPVFVEYCSGNGTWIAERAKEFPKINWVAVELRFDRVKKIWSKVKNFELDNLIVLSGEGEFATRTYFPSHSFEEIFVNFPDPWPKLRHAKHRIFKPSFVTQCARILTPKGKMTVVTDEEEYSKQIVCEVLHNKEFRSCLSPPYFTKPPEGYGSSYFDTLWRTKGKEIRYHLFEKIEACSCVC